MAADKQKTAVIAVLHEFMEDFDDSTDFLTKAVSTIVTTSNASMRCLENFDNSPIRIVNYVETVVPAYSDVDFRSHFRMNRSTFQELCTHVAPSLAEKNVTVEKKTLAALWLLSNQESYRGIADRFGMSKGTLHLIVNNVFEVLASKRKEFISFPNRQEMQAIASEFRQRCGFPGVIGAIDGTHIAIPGPTDNRDAYINRKGYPSIQIQVVCDNRLRFLDVDTGWPGSVHDARIFRKSDLHDLLETSYLPANMHLIGDYAYPLKSYLMVPFRDNGHLSPTEKKYNKSHSSTRVEVERAIGLLKCKFRRLKFLDMHVIYNIPVVLISACVLHNFVLMRENIDEDLIEIDPRENVEQEPLGERELPSAAASAKRDEIANSLA